MASPDSPSASYRPGLNTYIPLICGYDDYDESVLSTRGQRLPQIIQNRSATNLMHLTHASLGRRQSIQKRASDEEEGLALSASEARSYGDRDMTNGEISRNTSTPEFLSNPQMRSMRLIGNSNPRYQWAKYYKSEEELKKMKKSIRRYYERNNFLVSQYLYIDRLLDSSMPHELIQEYHTNLDIPSTIREEPPSPGISPSDSSTNATDSTQPDKSKPSKVKRTPKAIYKITDETTPLLASDTPEDHNVPLPDQDERVDSNQLVVTMAIYINLTANFILLICKSIVIALTSSLSVLASLVDAALDFLSTAIVWTTTKMVRHKDQYAYPVGRRRLEPIGVLVFSVIMITSFFQVSLECFSRLTSGDESIVQLSLPSILIMAGTVVVKGACWMWCRLIKNSSVQALAQDAMTDVVFNTFSIIFPIIGYYAKVWWCDALGGLLLSLYVIFNWSRTTHVHIRNLTGAAASADERNVLLYLTMRFAKTIKQIQGLQAYHSGDKLNVEVDVVVDEGMSLRDSHDLGESLQYVLESVPGVERAFVHLDYAGWNLPSHMLQDEEE
ncbi:MAG: hypothetical protein M1834_006327 [Cirrosporium novae-zelandiae]|nr:MAG: hypothetical protein M1834_006327 [Cirrosporium novae-zelandiae]